MLFTFPSQYYTPVSYTHLDVYKRQVECSCQRTQRKKQEALINQQKHLDRVRRLKAEGFSDPAMLDWTFENDNGRSPQMYHAHRYVE